ncbi:DEKNAAC105108 [Brettanomyces naardenensis]|uniref:DEKNAAC105108 n=1 Tax=Brettanomyces naardenensis TaxID=13370 RepID=A0A448YT01_BRENA|nr:DEKNAAC105108 [Brettanomyces naardenensis]
MRKADLSLFLAKIGKTLRKDFPSPEINPYDEIYNDRVIIEASGCVSRYRDIIEFKRTQIKVLDKQYLADHADDEHLTRFLKRLQFELGGPEDSDGLLERRYGISEVLSGKKRQEEGESKVDSFDTYAAELQNVFGKNPARIERKEPEYNESTERIKRILQQGAALHGGERPLSDAVVAERRNGMALKEEDDDDNLQLLGDDYWDQPSPIKISQEDSRPPTTTTYSTVRTTSLERIIQDGTLSGTFQVPDVKIIGYLPSENEPLVETDPDQKPVLTDTLELIVTTGRSGPPAIVDRLGNLLCTEYLRVGFETGQDALKYLGLSDGEVTESYVRSKLRKLVNKTSSSIHVTGIISDAKVDRGRVKWIFSDSIEVN